MRTRFLHDCIEKSVVRTDQITDQNRADIYRLRRRFNMQKLLNTYLPVIQHLSRVRLLAENSRVNREQRDGNELTYMQLLVERDMDFSSHLARLLLFRAISEVQQSHDFSNSRDFFLNSRYFEPNLNSLHQSNTVVLPRFFKRPDISKKFASFVIKAIFTLFPMHA